MPANPMPRSPHKRVNGWAKGYNPEFSKHTVPSSGHGGNMPPGKLKKMARVKTQPPGYPQGVHLVNAKDGQLCLCGGCYSTNKPEKYW